MDFKISEDFVSFHYWSYPTLVAVEQQQQQKYGTQDVMII